MSKKRYFSIGNKISVIVTILNIIIITLFYLYNNFITYPTIKDEKVNRIKEITSLFKDDILIVLSFDDINGVKDVLKKIDSMENVLKMEVKDKKENLIASYSKVKINSNEKFNNKIKLITEPIPYFLYFYSLDEKHYMTIYYSAKSYLKTIDDYQKFTILTSIIILFIISIFFIIIKKFLTPFTKLANTIYNLNFSHFNRLTLETNSFNDERGLIINSVQNMLNKIDSTLRELNELNLSLEAKVREKTIKLEEFNLSLQKKVDDEVEKNRQKDRVMFQQARLAQMGEMIGNIAHQWRQPLNEIGLIIQSFEIAYFKGKLNEEFIEKRVAEGDELVDSMSNTIDDFRNFFSPTKEKQNFIVDKAISKSIQMIKASLENNAITLVENLNKNIKIFGYESEFEQVILNILSNAKDVLLEKDAKNKLILIQSKVELKENLECVLIEVYDSGEGISEKIIDRIFEPYFTTKEEGKGTGIGLYMSKTIIENMHGKLQVKNSDFKVGEKGYYGAYFSIEIPI